MPEFTNLEKAVLVEALNHLEEYLRDDYELYEEAESNGTFAAMESVYSKLERGA